MRNFWFGVFILAILAYPPGIDAQEPGWVKTLAQFHGHTCAGSLMGARLGLAAKTALVASDGEKLKAKVFLHVCPVDGVQITAGTTYGNRAIEVEEQSQMRLLLTSEKSGRKVDVTLTPAAEAKGKEFRKLKDELRALPPNSPRRLELEKSITEILTWLYSAPEAEVVVVTLVK